MLPPAKGGALFAAAGGKTTLSLVTFSNNTASDNGGAIAIRTNEIEISQCTFTQNTASSSSGGAFYTNLDGGARNIVVDKSTFSKNQADLNGGAILNDANLTITNSTFLENTAGGNGGAIIISPFDPGPPALETNITNSTLSGNSAKQHGGGIYHQNDGNLSLNNVTVTGNTADSDNNSSGDGGGFYEKEQAVVHNEATFQNTILSGNTDNGGEAPNCGGDAAGDHLNSGDYNLIQDTTGCTIGGTTTNNITGQNANLGVLADNGGDTETHALNSGSPAIDAGNPGGCKDHNGTDLTTDQRGDTRPVNGRCDIGAYEVSAAAVVGVGTGASTDGNGSAGGVQACGSPCPVGSAGKYCTFDPCASVNIPANVVQDGSQVIVSEILDSNLTGNFQLGGSFYDIKIYGPDGQLVTFFDPPLEICIMPTNAALSAAGWNFDNLVLFHSHAGGAWNAIQDTYKRNGSLCGKVWQLSLFTLTVPGMPATGFPPGVLTTLEEQPDEKAYFDLWLGQETGLSRNTCCWSQSAEGSHLMRDRAPGDFRLAIPALGVELPIVGVPLSLDGWDVTWLGERAGYLEGTAFPTWAGNTAITAHVWNADNTPGPFVDLNTLQHGDQVIIHAWGQNHIYEVREIMQVRPDNLYALTHSEYNVLTLITCQGFDEVTGEYDWRLTVRAVLMEVDTE